MKDNLFNIDLLILDKKIKERLLPVSSLAIFEPNSQVFHKDGLFSLEVFGQLGTKTRNEQFGYINLNTKILHPLVYQQLISLKKLYKDVAEGNKYAVYDEEEGDLVLSDMENGKTGYNFLLSNIKKLKLYDNNSPKREFKIKLIEKYTDPKDYLQEWLVLPAGLRDYTIDKKGVPSEDEVNDLYRKLLVAVNNINNINVTDENIEMLDNIRVKIQKITLEIYLHFESLLKGKKKFVSGKWSKRGVMHGTRNVMTPFIYNINNIDNIDINMNYSIIGLYQFIKAIAPVTMNRVHNLFIGRIFNPEDTNALLVNKETLQTEMVEVPLKKKDEWLSLDGLNNVMNKLAQDDLKIEPITVGDHYLMLIYDDGKNIEIIPNSDFIRDDMDKKYIRPITYAELFYIAIYSVRDKYPAFITRYPVANLGSIYPSKLYVKTTFKSRTVTLTMDGQKHELKEYPILTEKFVNSISPHGTRLARMQGDLTI